MLTDNDVAFTFGSFRNFLKDRDNRPQILCPSIGTRILERYHRTIKTIVARKQFTIEEVVY